MASSPPKADFQMRITANRICSSAASMRLGGTVAGVY
jgi:hypothetical protein